MRNKKLSNFSNAELSQFSNLELKIKQMEEIADILSHSEMTIPAETSRELTSLIKKMAPDYLGHLTSLSDVIHAVHLLMSTYSQLTGNLNDFNLLLSLLDELIKYFNSKVK